MSAIIWANITTLYYCNGVKAAEDIGFRDDYIYNFIQECCSDKNIMEMHHIPLEEGQKLYDDYAAYDKEMY